VFSELLDLNECIVLGLLTGHTVFKNYMH